MTNLRHCFRHLFNFLRIPRRKSNCTDSHCCPITITFVRFRLFGIYPVIESRTISATRIWSSQLLHTAYRTSPEILILSFTLQNSFPDSHSHDRIIGRKTFFGKKLKIFVFTIVVFKSAAHDISDYRTYHFLLLHFIYFKKVFYIIHYFILY